LDPGCIALHRLRYEVSVEPTAVPTRLDDAHQPHFAFIGGAYRACGAPCETELHPAVPRKWLNCAAPPSRRLRDRLVPPALRLAQLAGEHQRLQVAAHHRGFGALERGGGLVGGGRGGADVCQQRRDLYDGGGRLGRARPPRQLRPRAGAWRRMSAATPG
jgi:hypothetical protein